MNNTDGVFEPEYKNNPKDAFLYDIMNKTVDPKLSTPTEYTHSPLDAGSANPSFGNIPETAQPTTLGRTAE